MVFPDFSQRKSSKFQPPSPAAQDKDRTVAFITKGWAGGAQELFTSANSFYVAGMGSFLGIGFRGGALGMVIFEVEI